MPVTADTVAPPDPTGLRARTGRVVRDLAAVLDARPGSSLAFAGIAATVATLALLGWIFGVSWARQLAPDCPAMVPATGVCVLALATTWLLPRARALVTSAVVLLLGVVELVACAVPSQHGYLGLLSADGGAAERMSLFGATAVVLLAVARITAHRQPAGEPWSDAGRRTAQLASLGVLIFVVPVVLGYSLQHRYMTDFGAHVPTSLPSVLALGSLAVAMLLDIPRGVLPWMLRGRDAGGALLRRVLPATFVLLPVIAYLRVLGQRAGWYGSDVGVLILTTSSLVTVGIVTYLAAERLARTDRVRAEAVDTLRAITLDVDALVDARADELAASRHARELERDRERISAELHDVVIQRLYAISLSLDARLPGDPSAASAVDGIDAAIAELRGTIFNLRSSAEDVSIDRTLTDLHWLCRAADFRLDVHTEGALDAMPTPVRVHLAAVVREAVTNAVRHSGGRTISLRVLRTEREVAMLCADDGHGLRDGDEVPSALRTIRTRAADLGGQATWAPNMPYGTAVTWRAPLCTGRDALPAQARGAAVGDPDGASVASLATYAALCPIDRLTAAGALLARQTGTEAYCVVANTPQDRDHLTVVAGAGLPHGAVGVRFHRDASLSAPAIDSGQCLTVAHVATASAVGRLVTALPDGPALLAPVAVQTDDGTIDAAIVLLRHAHREPFGTADLARAEAAVRLLGTALHPAGRGA